MKKYFLFDLDGTITKPKEGITKCVQYSLKYFDIDEPDLDKLECFIGPPLHQSYMKYYNLTEKEAYIAVEKYRERYTDIGIFECEVYKGIDEVLKTIKSQGGIIGLATSKPEEFAIRLLEYYKMDQYFDCITGAMMNGERTDKTEVMRLAFSRMNINDMNKELVVMIGDRLHDIIGAKNMGVESIGVKYGYSVGEELVNEGATYIVKTTKELNELVNKLIK